MSEVFRNISCGGKFVKQTQHDIGAQTV